MASWLRITYISATKKSITQVQRLAAMETTSKAVLEALLNLVPLPIYVEERQGRLYAG